LNVEVNDIEMIIKSVIQKKTVINRHRNISNDSISWRRSRMKVDEDILDFKSKIHEDKFEPFKIGSSPKLNSVNILIQSLYFLNYENLISF
jgi:hypothetical protein